MTEINKDDTNPRMKIVIIVYPAFLFLGAVLANYFAFGVLPISVALPSPQMMIIAAIGGISIAANHTWLMTATELVRLRFKMHATPEEWKARNRSPEQVPDEGWQALARCQNAHRNATENTVSFIFLASVLVLASPPEHAAASWILGFGIARLGHTYSYLTKSTSLRGAFMSLSLLSLYGIASYLLLAVFVEGSA